MNTAAAMEPAAPTAAGTLTLEDAADGTRVLKLAGRLDPYSIAGIWPEARAELARAPTRRIVIDAASVEYCDGGGVAMLVDLLRQPRASGADVVVRGLKPEFHTLLDQFDPRAFVAPAAPPPPQTNTVEEIGRATAQLLRDMRTQVAFIGETTEALWYAVTHPHRIRWKDVWYECEQVGANALPIVALISFLLGVILAFQAAVPMRQFGAEIFVADLVGLSILRELGPLMTAILLAGRSGAALLMVPLLSLFANLVGVLAGGLTMLSFNIPLVTYLKEVDSIVDLKDLMAGLIKTPVFALLIAGIGCLRGLQTETGASAVGISATRAVVSGIVLLVAVDGIFAVIYYILDI